MKNFSSYRTVITAEGTSMAVVAFEVGRAETYASAQDTVVVLHDNSEQGCAVLEFLSQQSVCGKKVHIVNIRDYLRHSSQPNPMQAGNSLGQTAVLPPSVPPVPISLTDPPR
jgi:hypothetical protein